MEIVVFGGTGPSGKLVIEQALAAGHRVTAFARNPEKLGPVGAGLTLVKGELTDAPAIEAAIVGRDAVISLLGPNGKATGTPVADGMGIIVQSMKRQGVRRLIASATPSAADPNDRMSLPFWLAVRMIKTLARSAYHDIVATADTVCGSDLEWTLVRLPMLSDAPSIKPAAAGYLGDPRIRLFSLSRSSLAEFVIQQLTDPVWIRRAPVLSNGR